MLLQFLNQPGNLIKMILLVFNVSGPICNQKYREKTIFCCQNFLGGAGWGQGGKILMEVKVGTDYFLKSTGNMQSIKVPEK